jgi:hypothetical protein
MELSSARKVPSRCSPLGLRRQAIAYEAPDRPEALVGRRGRLGRTALEQASPGAGVAIQLQLNQAK